MTRLARRMISRISATSASILRLEQHGVVHGRDQRQVVAGAPDVGEAEYVGAGALDRPISDRALAQFRDAGGTFPTEHSAHLAGGERVMQPILGPMLILREQFAV